MFVEQSHRKLVTVTVDGPRRLDRNRFGCGSTAALSRTRIARKFYCDVLRGQEVWDAERAGNVSFIVEGTRVDVTRNRSADIEPVILSVSDPHALAERCWDAGFNVCAGQDARGFPTLAVIDPFGRRIELVR
jgi:hypothetical protein